MQHFVFFYLFKKRVRTDVYNDAQEGRYTLLTQQLKVIYSEIKIHKVRWFRNWRLTMLFLSCTWGMYSHM